MFDITRFKREFKVYTELRRHTNYMNNIRIIKGNVMANSMSSKGGISARSFNGGYWGMASSPLFTDDETIDVIHKAGENALLLKSKGDKNYTKEFFQRPIVINKNFRTLKPKFSQKQRVDFCMALDDYIAKKYSDLMSRNVQYFGINMEKNLLTSEGTESYTFTPKSQIFISMTADRQGSPVNLMRILPVGGLGEFEDFYCDPENLYGYIDAQYEDLMKKKEGVFPEGGMKDCILAPDLAGILAHEAVGHTVEADIVLSGSIAYNLLGEKVASDLVTMVDFANTAFGETCQVPVYVDDEGTEAMDQIKKEINPLLCAQ